MKTMMAATSKGGKEEEGVILGKHEAAEGRGGGGTVDSRRRRRPPQPTHNSLEIKEENKEKEADGKVGFVLFEREKQKQKNRIAQKPRFQGLWLPKINTCSFFLLSLSCSRLTETWQPGAGSWSSRCRTW